MTINGCDLDQPLTADFITKAKAAGHIAAGRYIKNLTAGEIALCARLGFRLWLISEGMGNAQVFAGGFRRGGMDGTADLVKMEKLGIPQGVVVYVAVDYEADKPDVNNIGNYLAGYAAVQKGNRIGLYADGVIASAVPTPVGIYVPGALGWPGTRAFLAAGKNIAIVQHAPRNLFGVDTDPCEVRDESVLWDPAAGQKNAPAAEPPAQGGEMPQNAGQANPMPDLKAAQAFLRQEADGIWGPKTATAFALYYTHGAGSSQAEQG